METSASFEARYAPLPYPTVAKCLPMFRPLKSAGGRETALAFPWREFAGPDAGKGKLTHLSSTIPVPALPCGLESCSHLCDTRALMLRDLEIVRCWRGAALPESVTAGQHERLMATMRELENESTLIGASAHIMGIAIKPNG